MHISTKNKLKNFGLSRYCPICKSFVRSFKPINKRNNAVCPVCGSFERHRLVWLYFKNNTNLFAESIKMLHAAPENCFVRRFKKLKNLNYTSIDFDSKFADMQMDLTSLKFDNESFDVFYCSHVLEHIPDDKKAIREIYRILKPGGWALIVIPVFGLYTSEDLTITDPEKRKQMYGQNDHVRKYGIDIVDKFKVSGFKVQVIKYYEKISNFKKKYFGLSNEIMFYLEKNTIKTEK